MTDPILDELHAVRRQMLADAGGTLAGLVAKIQADQAKSGRVVMKTTDKASGPRKLTVRRMSSVDRIIFRRTRMSVVQ